MGWAGVQAPTLLSMPDAYPTAYGLQGMRWQACKQVREWDRGGGDVPPQRSHTYQHTRP